MYAATNQSLSKLLRVLHAQIQAAGVTDTKVYYVISS